MKAALLLLTMFQSADLFPVTAKPEPVKAEAGRYLVVFTTKTCGPCRQWKANEKPKLAGQFITMVDADEQPQWEVAEVPSFWIVDRATRKPIEKLTGYRSAEVLLSKLNPEQTQVVADDPVKIEPFEERRMLIEHLLNDGIHSGRHTSEKLEAMSLEDLETLHTLEHNSGAKWYVQPKRVQTIRRRRGLFFEW